MNNKNDIGFLMQRYQKFLTASRYIAFLNSEDTDLKDDWLEANWELIVESHFNLGNKRVNLSLYGAGAERKIDRGIYRNLVGAVWLDHYKYSGRILFATTHRN